MPVVTDVNEVVDVLTWVSNEMARRYRTFSKAGVRNLASYNAAPPEDSDGPLPNIVVVIDELADLMMTAPGDVERLLARLAQMARATGIHLVIATQRPSVDVITGLIKANFPTRISFMVSSQADSRTVLDSAGAERLIGRGDMLYAPPEGGKAQRIQGARVTDEEVRAVVQHWREQGEPAQVSRQELQRSEEDEEDQVFVEATELVMRHDSVTPDQLARELGIGRSLALKLGHRLEEEGFVGPPAPAVPAKARPPAPAGRLSRRPQPWPRLRGGRAWALALGNPSAGPDAAPLSPRALSGVYPRALVQLVDLPFGNHPPPGNTALPGARTS